MARTWTVRSRRSPYVWSGVLLAYWECDYDPISDDYTPDEISPHELFDSWVKKVAGIYPDGLIPISWYVSCWEQGKFERMPFQARPSWGVDFFSFYHWPTDSRTGAPLNWFTVPVVDKRWTPRRFDKGGFIQEATGWKPHVLQATVPLDLLRLGASMAWRGEAMSAFVAKGA